MLARSLSVLNARTPGGRVWALLMVMLVVVFLIPWLEMPGRVRRCSRSDPAPSRVALDPVLRDSGPDRRDQLSPDPFRLRRALAWPGFHPGIPQSHTCRLAGPQRQSLLWSSVSWTFAMAVSTARWSAERAPSARGPIRAALVLVSRLLGRRLGLANLRNDSIARPRSRNGPCD